MSDYQHQDLISPNKENQPQKNLQVTSKMKALFIAAIFVSVMIANFIFISGFALGFSVTVLVAEILIFAILPAPASRKTLILCIFLAISIVGLGATYTVFSDILLSTINFFVILLLLFFQLLLYSQALPYDWDRPEFILDLFIAPFIRPFISLPSLLKVGKAFLPRKKDQNETSAPTLSYIRKSIGLRILAGFLFAFPVMIIAVLLLSSADPVFKSIFDGIVDFLSKISFDEIVGTVVISAFCFPLLFSFMFTYLTKWNNGALLTEPLFTAGRKFSIDSIIAATFLFCVNILYAIFAYVQFTNLFFSFKNILPENLTYAQYVRQGFFQLAAITFINLLIIIVSLTLTKRKGVTGILVRIQSVLLIFFTFVQLASAVYRMKMYIDAYSLSKLRVFVSIFMGLIAILLILALLKEFMIKFRFLKVSVIISITVLLFTNYINVNALIADYNINRYLDENIKIDTGYLINELSNDAIIYVIPLMDDNDAKLAKSVKFDILSAYSFDLSYYDNRDLRRYSYSKDMAKKAVENYFGGNLAKELEKFNDGYYDSDGNDETNDVYSDPDYVYNR
ncbi:MAG: DUF4153 domain-containing protein [Saccharofermentanales bacterium]